MTDAVKPFDIEKGLSQPRVMAPTVVRRSVVLAVFDLLALAILYFVLQDLAWRKSYAESEGLTISTKYSLFVRIPKISNGGPMVKLSLVSPPALDWVQVIVVTLVLVNGFYAFRMLRASRNGK